MKTAMEQLIELLEVGKKYSDTMPFLIDVIKEVYMKKEKEQLEQSWEAGMSEGIGTTVADLDYDGEFINYFNETYGK